MKFDGTFSGIYQWIDTSGGIELSNIVVSEEELTTNAWTVTPRTGRHLLCAGIGRRSLCGLEFSATDEIRRFEVNYVVHNAILKHNDVAEFYYQFVGERWDQSGIMFGLSCPALWC